jgi:hypothetical protein
LALAQKWMHGGIIPDLLVSGQKLLTGERHRVRAR